MPESHAGLPRGMYWGIFCEPTSHCRRSGSIDSDGADRVVAVQELIACAVVGRAILPATALQPECRAVRGPWESETADRADEGSTAYEQFPECQGRVDWEHGERSDPRWGRRCSPAGRPALNPAGCPNRIEGRRAPPAPPRGVIPGLTENRELAGSFWRGGFSGRATKEPCNAPSQSRLGMQPQSETCIPRDSIERLPRGLCP